MRIWLINHYAVSPAKAGGTRHFTLARELVRRGHVVTIFASALNYVIRRSMPFGFLKLWKTETTDGVRFVWLRTPSYRGNTLGRVLNMAMFAVMLWIGLGTRGLGRPDVILGSTPHLFAPWAAWRLARRLQVPFVLEVRDLWPESLIGLTGFSRKHLLVLALARLERFLYQRAEAVITLLPNSINYIVERGGRLGRVIWLPNGMDVGALPPPELPTHDGTFTVMYAGSHGRINGLDVVLDAALLLQQGGWGNRVSIQLVGDGPEKDRLQQRARDEGISLVRFRDPVPKAQVYRVLQDANAFLLVLSDSPVFRWGVSPNKLFDYLASCRPVVFAVNSSPNPVVQAGAGYAIPPEDPVALAEAITRLASLSPQERWEMGLRGRRYVEEHHDFRRLCDTLVQVLEGVLGA